MSTPRTAPDVAPARWSRLTAADIMQKGILTVSDATPLSEVERLLSEHRISGVPVTDQAGKVIGVVSIRDLLDRYVEDPDARPRRGKGYYRVSFEEMEDEDLEFSEDLAASEETAGSIMTAEVYHVPSTAPVVEVARKMVGHKIHRVIVTDPKDGRVVGIISSMGILAAVSA